MKRKLNIVHNIVIIIGIGLVLCIVSRKILEKMTLNNLVYYSCFFGKSTNIANKIPELPSKKHNCYFYSNNKDTLRRAKAMGWIPIYIETPIKDSDRDNAMDSKELKACPHHYPELRGYTYSCYLDSKLKVKDEDIQSFLNEMKGDITILVNPHPDARSTVWDEFNTAMGQARYAQDSDAYRAYINDKLNSGLKETSDTFFETCLILRKSIPEVDQIGEDWLNDIQKTGPECQISFFFIYQRYAYSIQPLSRYYGRN